MDFAKVSNGHSIMNEYRITIIGNISNVSGIPNVSLF